MLVAKLVILKVESRLSANVHWMVKRAFHCGSDEETNIVRQKNNWGKCNNNPGQMKALFSAMLHHSSLASQNLNMYY